MTISFEEKVTTENAQLVCQWSNSLGKSFQEQWMGTMIPFPLTVQVLQDLEGIFSIFEGQEFVGLIQKIRLEDKNLHIGRFFINPQKQGQGLGSQALRKFVTLAFENEDIDSISLNVYEVNQRAQNLYRKEGFEIVQMVETPIRKYIMKKGRQKANSLEINVDCDYEPESAPQKGLYMNERYQCLKTKEYQALLSFKGRQIFAKRKIDMKSVFGQIKVCLDYKRCHLRDKRKVRIDMGFVLMVNNLLKYNKRKRQN